jgi:hypothetical protein
MIELENAEAEANQALGIEEVDVGTNILTAELAAGAPTIEEMQLAEAAASSTAEPIGAPEPEVVPVTVEPEPEITPEVISLVAEPEVTPEVISLVAEPEVTPEVISLVAEPEVTPEVISLVAEPEVTPVTVEPMPTIAARRVTVGPGEEIVTIDVTAEPEVKKPLWKEPAVIAAGIAGTLGILAVLLRARR